MTYYKPCPSCSKPILFYKNPIPTVDVIIFSPPDNIVLIERKNYPKGWALPGGFVDHGERTEYAAIREAKEETGLEVVLTGLLGVYSDPFRDPRLHALSIVYMAYAIDCESIRAGDDALEASFFPWYSLPELAFDHKRIISDFIVFQKQLGYGKYIFSSKMPTSVPNGEG